MLASLRINFLLVGVAEDERDHPSVNCRLVLETPVHKEEESIAVCTMSGKKDMILYWTPGSTPCWRIMACLNEKGLDDQWEGRQKDMMKGEHKSEEILKINPRGQVRGCSTANPSYVRMHN